jgi:hypothetical protein
MIGINLKSAVLLTMLGLTLGISGCKRTEPPATTAPATEAPAEASKPATQPLPAPAPVPEPAPALPTSEPAAPASPAVAGPGATTGPSKGKATNTSRQPPVLRAVRSAKQAGFDRLVFEFDTVGLPAWDVEYVDKPVLNCGSGEPVKVAGDAWLQIRFTGAQAHTEHGKSTSGPRRRPLAQTIARELVRICDFEGEVTWVVGVSRPNPYTPRIMTAPSRLVIDIAH